VDLLVPIVRHAVLCVELKKVTAIVRIKAVQNSPSMVEDFAARAVIDGTCRQLDFPVAEIPIEVSNSMIKGPADSSCSCRRPYMLGRLSGNRPFTHVRDRFCQQSDASDKAPMSRA
jgi:hypothetical protein